MNQSPNNFNFDDHGLNFSDLEGKAAKELQEIENLSPESRERLSIHKKQLERLIIYLAGFGFGVGLLLAIVLTIVLNKLGLTKKPNQLPPPESEKLEQIKYHPNQSFQELNFL
ncbi:hypothetical protein Sta7437_3574 [Stanieria cyanosphaera PCC 7437]|uniref:Uncharacterized protein n=1 Tax=Stanieria cyanosphaera (strain ATCC 29371 / PCC 7437) TaxID=111780 RepID=K9XZK1_STAC7|nr:hypothetical protein [Stanieria cyanosphaera]AFZ37072.1 hypothetical protein Sta7437_3574 [Stanieria cyanosphaera PCC 7437]